MLHDSIQNALSLVKLAIPIILLLFALASCQTNNEDNFNSFIGSKKAQVIHQTKDHFSDFLKENFEGRSDLERTINLLTVLDTTSDLKPDWSWDLKTAQSIVSAYESTGLRNDFELYGYEENDSIFSFDHESDSFSILATTQLGTLDIELQEEEFIPIAGSDTAVEKTRIEAMELASKRRWDSSLHYNVFGRYQFGLKKYYHQDSTVFSYLQAIDATGGNISPQILANGLKGELEKRRELTEGVKLIILFEFYLPYLRNELENCC